MTSDKLTRALPVFYRPLRTETTDEDILRFVEAQSTENVHTLVYADGALFDKFKIVYSLASTIIDPSHMENLPGKIYLLCKDTYRGVDFRCGISQKL